MTWSLNEVEALAKKAARGAGMGWGHAEEAGKATRWLCAAGWPGAEALAGTLTACDGEDWQDRQPRIENGTWSAPGGAMCPVAAGAALCDRAGDLTAGRAVQLLSVRNPALLIPYMVWAADMTGARLAVAWEGVQVSRGMGETFADIASPDSLSAARAKRVTIGPADQGTGRQVTRAYRGDMTPGAARILQDFAQTIYAPETEESRLAGAGAGLTDND